MSKNEGSSCWHQGKCGHVLGGSTGAVRTELGGWWYLPVKCSLQHLAEHQVPQGGEWPVVFSLVRAVAWKGKGVVCLPARVCKVPMQPPMVTSMQEEEPVPSLGKRAKTIHTTDQSCSYSEKSPLWYGGEDIQKERHKQQMETFKVHRTVFKKCVPVSKHSDITNFIHTMTLVCTHEMTPFCP